MNILPIDETRNLFGNIALSDENYARFSRYADLLVEWNEKINLTAITDPQGITEKHFLDSILPYEWVNLPENASVIDVGTGAGFPGIPLKIMRDDIHLTLLDSLNKRINFLNTVCDDLNIIADCIHGRAEDMGTTQLREKFDIATARAVARLSVLCEYCLPLVKVGGMFVALKGSSGVDELKDAENAIKKLGGEPVSAREYSLPCGDGRTLVIIKKIAPTPKGYPRPKGKMNKNPL